MDSLLRSHTVDARSVFLKQRLSSDYCAVYAAGMTLSLCGRPTDRRSAHRLFKVGTPSWRVPNHDEVCLALEIALPGATVALDSRRCADGLEVREWLASKLRRRRAVMVTARCELVEPRVTALHAFVVVRASENRIGLLDPLGSAPRPGDDCNAWIDAVPSAPRRYLAVRGAPHRIDISAPLSVFDIRG